jgi:hypothetical protein
MSKTIIVEVLSKWIETLPDYRVTIDSNGIAIASGGHALPTFHLVITDDPTRVSLPDTYSGIISSLLSKSPGKMSWISPGLIIKALNQGHSDSPSKSFDNCTFRVTVDNHVSAKDFLSFLSFIHQRAREKGGIGLSVLVNKREDG